MAHVALPPDVYVIQNAAGHKVTNPQADGENLSLSNTDLGLRQQWQITGDGIITSMDNVHTRSAFAIQPSLTNALVNRNNIGTSWFIKVKWDGETRKFKGTIMSPDTRRHYWGFNSTSVLLKSTSTEFTFVPVVPV